MTEQKSAAARSLSNIVKAIEAGIINETTKTRMNELEETIKELNCKILTEQIKLESFLTKEEIVEFIYKSLKREPTGMIRVLVKQVVVYDDKLEIFYNYTSKNPDDSGRDLTLLKSSDSYPMVEVRRVELLACIKTEKPSTYLVLLLISC